MMRYSSILCRMSSGVNFWFFLKDEPVVIEDKSFTDVITYTLLIKTEDEEDFVKRVVDLSEGTVEPLRYEEIYYPWSE